MKQTYVISEVETFEEEVTTVYPILGASGPSPATDDDLPVVGDNQIFKKTQSVYFYGPEDEILLFENEKSTIFFDD